LDDVFSHIDQQRDEYIALLQELIRQPSVAAQGVGMSETAALVILALREAGISATTYDTRGGFPVVYGELDGKSRKRLQTVSKPLIG
jgi:acetylornithine deacetylase/succinyl-diaminopimelate desuccinylase-like protein